jgi:hypothetical protein
MRKLIARSSLLLAIIGAMSFGSASLASAHVADCTGAALHGVSTGGATQCAEVD